MTTTTLQPSEQTGTQAINLQAQRRQATFVQRFRRSRRAVIGLTFLLIVTAITLLAPVLAPYAAGDQNAARTQLPPFSTATDGGYHLLGTDALGRDLLSRIMYGGRVSLLVGVTVVAVAGLVGVPLGLLSGFFGNWVDTIIMRLVDIQLAVPFILLAIAIMAVLGTGLWNVIFVLGFSGWVGYARIVRGTVLSLREQPFIEIGALYRLIQLAVGVAPSTPQRLDAGHHLGNARRGRRDPG